MRSEIPNEITDISEENFEVYRFCYFTRKSQMGRYLICIVILLVIPFGISAQIGINGYVKNSENSEIIPFATIQIMGSAAGTVSNEEGFFVLRADVAETDSIIISSLAFKTEKVSLSYFQDSSIVFLSPQTYALTEVEINPLDEEKIFNELAKLITIYRRNREGSFGKAYFRLQTLSKDEPIELLEAFYNIQTKVRTGPTSFELKMGRFGQNKLKKFYSLNTTNQIAGLNIFAKNGNSAFPKWCGNMNPAKLKTYYRILSYSEFEAGYNLKLESRLRGFFDVELDVNSSTNKIDRIYLTSNNESLEGYSSIIQSDSLKYTKLEIEIKYYPGTDNINLISMEQGIDYFHNKVDLERYNTKVDILMVDYENLFINPGDYSTIDLTNDYAKIIAYGFDTEFWESNNSIKSSKSLAGQWDAITETGDVAYLDGDSVSNEILETIQYPLMELDSTSQITWSDFGLNSSEINIDKIYQKRLEGEYSRVN